MPDDKDNWPGLRRQKSAIPDVGTVEGRTKLRTMVEGSKSRMTHDSAIVLRDDLERIRLEAKIPSQAELHTTKLLEEEKRKTLVQASMDRKNKLNEHDKYRS